MLRLLKRQEKSGAERQGAVLSAMLQWPKGFKCPTSGYAKPFRLEHRDLRQYSADGKQAPAATDVLFQRAELQPMARFPRSLLSAQDKRPHASRVKVDDAWFRGVREGGRGSGAEGKTHFADAH
ncbi:MAG: hypothetical protein OXI87_21840 [Albidovulum sp.]|nr:hypothetical protein [Albidovulum sp.]